MKFGLDRLLSDPALSAPLKGRRVALVAHPASTTQDLTHAVDALAAHPDITLSAAFGPQHGMKGDLQDNMMESPDYTDPVHGIPVFSLYGEVRRPRGEWMETFDVVLIDLQDVGCRIYTFVTTLLYMLEAAAEHGKEVWVLGSPQPCRSSGRGHDAGRGLGELRRRRADADAARDDPRRDGPVVHRPLQAGMWPIGSSRWRAGKPAEAPGYGWPLSERSWINPSPNAPNVSMTRAYAGTVMLEGATLSEGRGTTRPLELFGAPDIDARAVIAEMKAFAPQWLKGCVLRDMWFEPTFHKHAGKLCSGVQIHVDDPVYDHEAFQPWRVQALGFKAVRRLYPDYDLWRDFPYEYAFGKLPIDVINGGPSLREWVDNPTSTPDDLDAIATPDEQAWLKTRAPFLLY